MEEENPLIMLENPTLEGDLCTEQERLDAECNNATLKTWAAELYFDAPPEWLAEHLDIEYVMDMIENVGEVWRHLYEHEKELADRYAQGQMVMYCECEDL